MSDAHLSSGATTSEQVMLTTTEKGAPALTAAGVAHPLFSQKERGGALTVLSASLVGPRGAAATTVRNGRVLMPSALPSDAPGAHDAPNVAAKAGSSGVSMDALTAMMCAVLEEGKAVGQYTEQLTDLMVLMFQVLDVLKGRGERALFINMFVILYTHAPDARPTLLRLLCAVPHYGCWRTLASLYAVTHARPDMADVAHAIVVRWARALAADDARLSIATTGAAVMGVGAAIDTDAIMGAAADTGIRTTAGLSFAGKWAPRLGGAMDRACGLGVAIVNKLVEVAPHIMNPPSRAVDEARSALASATIADAGASAGACAGASAEGRKERAHAMRYRQLLTRLRAALCVPEVHMCARTWSRIEPTRVPSLANHKYRAAIQNVIGTVRRHPRTLEDKGRRAGIDLVVAARRQRSGAASVPGSHSVPDSNSDSDSDSDVRRVPEPKRVRSHDVDRVTCATRVAEAVESSLVAARAALESGDVSAAQRLHMIKGARNQIHKLVEACLESDEVDPLVEAMWADMLLQLRAAGVFAPSVALADVSGSMTGLPMLVSIGLSILLAKLQPAGSMFADSIITFTDVPQWVRIDDCTTFHAAVKRVRAAPWSYGTNFALAMRLVLDRVVTSTSNPDVRRDMLPRQLYVFSDMQFDRAIEPRGSGYSSPYDAIWSISFPASTIFGLNGGRDIRDAYRMHGLTPPQIIFWNLRAVNPAFQADAGTPGIALVAGFSQEILRQFMMTGDMSTIQMQPDAFDTAAWEQLQISLANERYAWVRERVAVCLEATAAATEVVATTEAAAATEVVATTEAAATTEVVATTEAAATTEVVATTEAAATTEVVASQ